MVKKKANKTPEQIRARKIRNRIIAIIFLTLCLGVVGIGGYLGYGIIKEVEDFSKDRLLTPESSVLMMEDGTEYYSYNKSGATKNVSYDDIPQVMIDAVIAAEDSRFFVHNGFDLPRIIKSVMMNLSAGGIRSGGSTITQQIIKKSYYPKEEQTYERKLGEIILAIKATEVTTKEEILELYLNKIYFGTGNKAIGLYSASRYYFDKDVQDLTLPEAALLAGTINSPVSYDPFNNLDLATKRRNIILSLMTQHGYITKEEEEIAKSIPVENTLCSNPISSGGKYQAYADRVTREIFEKTGYDPNSTPMKVYTYMDPVLQGKLDDIAASKTYKFQDDKIQTGVVCVENKTGRITGLISGRNYAPMGVTYAYAADKDRVSELGNYGQRNQPGSSLKPIIAYGAAFEFLDYSTAHIVHDVPYVEGDWAPNNFNMSFNGDTTIYDSLFNSWNLAAIQTLREVVTGKDCNGRDMGEGVGMEKVKDFIDAFGFDTYNEDFNLGYAIGAWQEGVTPEEEAGAYAAIANGGIYIEPHTVKKIILTDTGEEIDFDKMYEEEKVRACSEETAFMIKEVMTDYVRNAGSSFYYYVNKGLQIGAKTGTSNHSSDPRYVPHKSLVGKAKDGWFTSFSPDYSWSVWTGYTGEDQKEGYYMKSHNDVCKIAGMVADYLHNGKVKNKYPAQPDNVVKSQCISGIYPYARPTEKVAKDRIITGWFKKGNTPRGASDLSASLNEIQTFEASYNKDMNEIKVEFAKYDPESALEGKPTKKYKKKNGEIELTYLSDISQVYGKIVYQADIYGPDGKLIKTEKFKEEKGTISFTPTLPGVYKVEGYYAYENELSTSNKLIKNISIDLDVPSQDETTDQNNNTNNNTNSNTNNNNTNTNTNTNTNNNSNQKPNNNTNNQKPNNNENNKPSAPTTSLNYFSDSSTITIEPVMPNDAIAIISLQKGDKLIDSKVASGKGQHVFKKLDSKTSYTVNVSYILANGQKVDKTVIVTTK